ncbi:unnamed protein product [Heterosigma akashiwo]
MAAILEQSDSRSSADVLAEILSSLENISTWVESDQVCYGTIGSSWKSPSEDLKTALTVLNAVSPQFLVFCFLRQDPFIVRQPSSDCWPRPQRKL